MPGLCVEDTELILSVIAGTLGVKGISTFFKAHYTIFSF